MVDSILDILDDLPVSEQAKQRYRKWEAQVEALQQELERLPEGSPDTHFIARKIVDIERRIVDFENAVS